MTIRNIFFYFSLSSLLVSCYGVNEQTSQIGDYYFMCKQGDAWSEICQQYSPNEITDSLFLDGLKQIENHFLKPKYILYFKEEPREIVGCDDYSIRVTFNPSITYFAVDGLSPQLTDEEQIRIRNRVLNLLKEYECPNGQVNFTKFINSPAIFSKEYYDQR